MVIVTWIVCSGDCVRVSVSGDSGDGNSSDCVW